MKGISEHMGVNSLSKRKKFILTIAMLGNDELRNLLPPQTKRKAHVRRKVVRSSDLY